jgi:diguanylate cyclase (GGDEF)-like protein/PAS domain S-box-containing protein
MLAFRPDLPLAYSTVETLLSLVLSIVISAAGLYVAAQPDWRIATLGGALVGVAIAIMHYVGMSAIRIPGRIEWDLSGVSTSIGLGLFFASAAFGIASINRHISGAVATVLLLVLAVASLHFVGVSAVTIVPDGTALVLERSISPSSLAVMVSAVALSVLTISLITSIIDRRNQKWTSRQRALLDNAVNNMVQGLCMFDADGRVVIYNDRFRGMLGMTAKDLEDASFLSILKWRKEAGEPLESPELYAEKVRRKIDLGMISESVVKRPNGKIYHVVKSPCEGGGWVSTFEDVTNLKNAEKHILHMASHDTLTNLPNRVLFSERFDALRASPVRRELLAVMCVDQIRFRDVNDWFGRAVGDKLLKLVAERLSRCLRPSDLIARFGGDEFVVVQSGKGLTRSDVAKLARRLIEAASAPYSIEGKEITIDVSIGIAVAPDDGEELEQLLKSADLALYEAKAEGRRKYRFFEYSMNEEADRRHEIESDLRYAVERGEFELRYQPLYDLTGKHIVSAEALIRWNHPLRGLIGPGEFISIAEQTGLIVPISEWVIKQACSDAAAWPNDIRVAVNLSPLQFKAGSVLSSVKAALKSAGMQANRLECEITESILLQDTKSTIETLRELQNIGVRIAMDDFGTGYSSLSYLMKFPFDKIKIDQSFVREITSSQESRAIIQAVVGLAKQLKIKTTAEGVETQEQLEFLANQGCAELQGYLFSRPVPVAELGRLILASKPCEIDTAA